MQKGFALPLVLASLLLLSLTGASVYFYYQSQNNPTENTSTPQPSAEVQDDKDSNWKTYTDQEFGYSIQHPSNWYVYKLEDYPYGGFPGMTYKGQIIITSLNKFPRFSAGDGSGDQYLGVDISPLDQDVQPIVDKTRNYISPSGEKNLVETLTVNNHTAYKIIDPDKDVSIYIPFQNKKGGIFMSISSRTSISSENATAEKVLQTFKFLDDETANWKIYTEDTEISFRYPAECDVYAENGNANISGSLCPFHSVMILTNNSKGYTTETLVDYFISELKKGPDGIKLSRKDISVSEYKNQVGIIFKRIDIKSDFFWTDLLAIRNNKIYWIRLIPGEIGNAENQNNPTIELKEKIFYELVDTVRFLK